MQKLVNKLLIAFLKLISRLPMPVLYGLSNCFYVLLYKIFRYRLKVVQNNLKNSFPEKTDEELKKIEIEYYKYLCDLIVESVKGFTASRSELLKRVSYSDTIALDTLYENGQSGIVVMGHCGNWEWICRSAAFLMKNRVVVVYKPLSNPYFDTLMAETRTEFGVTQVPMASIGRYLIQQTEPYLLILLSDQSPSDAVNSHWMTFLNQETAVLKGAEKLAKKFDLPLIYNNVKRSKRGYYICSPKFIIENPKSYQNGEITELHTKVLEDNIREQPENWLWSHRRWKLRRSE
ncbi:MAG: lysophospholipid acyltransferase family protein [Bacteroidia bacterium]